MINGKEREITAISHYSSEAQNAELFSKDTYKSMLAL